MSFPDEDVCSMFVCAGAVRTRARPQKRLMLGITEAVVVDKHKHARRHCSNGSHQHTGAIDGKCMSLLIWERIEISYYYARGAVMQAIIVTTTVPQTICTMKATHGGWLAAPTNTIHCQPSDRRWKRTAQCTPIPLSHRRIRFVPSYIKHVLLCKSLSIMCIVCRVSYVCLLTLTLHISPKLTTWNFNIEFSMVFVC